VHVGGRYARPAHAQACLHGAEESDARTIYQYGYSASILSHPYLLLAFSPHMLVFADLGALEPFPDGSASPFVGTELKPRTDFYESISCGTLRSHVSLREAFYKRTHQVLVRLKVQAAHAAADGSSYEFVARLKGDYFCLYDHCNGSAWRNEPPIPGCPAHPVAYEHLNFPGKAVVDTVPATQMRHEARKSKKAA
jgi:hypothetical protein